MFATLAVAGGAIVPPAPTVSYGSLTNSGTQIIATITNYSSEYTYSATTTAGSLSRTGATVTITGLTAGSSFTLLIIATSAKGLSEPSIAPTSRLSYTYRTETSTGTRFVDTSSTYAPGLGSSCDFGGTLNVGGTLCVISSGYTESYTISSSIKNNTPAGYLDSGQDWYQIGNINIERTAYTYTTGTESYTYGCNVQSTCCIQLPYQSCTPGACTPNTCQVVGDPCVNNRCPPGWSCIAVGPNLRCAITVTQTDLCGCTQQPANCTTVCCSTYCSPCTVAGTCTGTRSIQIRNPIPPGYTDSGVDWYRIL